MSFLGKVEIGDTINIKTSLSNISNLAQNASSIKFSTVNDDNVIKINTTTANVSNYTTGSYYYDLYLSNNTFVEGLYHSIWTGYVCTATRNYSFYHEDSFYAGSNRLL